MSRVAKNPITLPKGVDVMINNEMISVKGPKGAMEFPMNPNVEVSQDEGVVRLNPANGNEKHWAMAGTIRALINNMVTGVSAGFERKLELVGVGYRAQAQGKTLNLTLGLSHPVEYPVPEGITIETPSQTEVVVKGIDKQQVGQVAAEIRSFRPPEPYKGKGVRYANEQIIRKEAKKK
ncbi:50S ribosomal protein L6 [Ectothiorhodospira marina]|uniref:Large ribosomal subunit protein uL6 n=1 Tax=Ectothiorhodospira marina TaxID=1396821 RepID=A0A1H7I367_9GAMM|nr:50S ribosomal protein L6 [Ectothiorhodospira marina]SEK56858.1 large subunit ribosomal protein L6 [Ectothiorhodospira marina]